jgi:AcrR family transcriptional regulator
MINLTDLSTSQSEKIGQENALMRHHGEIIEYFVRRSPMGISAISRELNISRRTLYNWFENKVLPDSIIGQLGRVIDHDFNKEFPDLFLNKKLIDSGTSNYDQSYGESKDAIYWMNKYIELLEAINKNLLLKKSDNQ